MPNATSRRTSRPVPAACALRPSRAPARRSCRRRSRSFTPKVAFEVDEIATSQALVARGAGVTLLPDLAIGRRHRDVVLASLGKAAPVRRVYAARLATRHPAPASDAMLAVLQEVAAHAS